MAKATAELRLPMIPVAVEIAGVGTAPAPCEVFLADTPRRGRSALADDLATLLEGELAFVPVRAAGRISLWAKHAIQWLALSLRDDSAVDAVPEPVTQAEPSEVLTLHDSKHEVEVTLLDGSTLSGSILHSAPADRPRMIDYLNRPGQFVRLWTGTAQYLINKHHVARVQEIEA